MTSLPLISHLTCPSACAGFRLRQTAPGPTWRRRGDVARQSGYFNDVLTNSGHVIIAGKGSATRRDGQQEKPHYRQTEKVLKHTPPHNDVKLMQITDPNTHTQAHAHTRQLCLPPLSSYSYSQPHDSCHHLVHTDSTVKKGRTHSQNQPADTLSKLLS